MRVEGADLSSADLQGVGQRIDGDTVEIVDAQKLVAGPSTPNSISTCVPSLSSKAMILTFAPRRRKPWAAVGTRARAEALTRFVNSTVQKKPTVSLPSAREVLRTRIGDCNEHTALFVAMSRAAGIPARIAVGLAYVRGAFYYHAWPEVYIDEGKSRGLWLPVDPTFNQFPADATHFRLARGGLDKQAAIIPMIGRVKITILDLEVVGGQHADARRTGPNPQPARRTRSRRSASASRDGACRVSWAVTNDLHSESAETVRRVHGRRRHRSRREARRNSRLSRTERRRQDHVDSDDCRPAQADLRAHRRQRPRYRDASGRREGSLGFIPDRPYIYEKLTAGEFLRFHAGLYGMDGEGLDQRVREMLDLFELGRWENELVESFSHGMKQRLVMCAAFLHRPQAVLVDEPMVGLDPRGAKLIKSVFKRMSEHGVAILMSTHTLEVAQEMCDRISIILKGKIIARGTVDELRAMAGTDNEELTPVFLKLTGGSAVAGVGRRYVVGGSALQAIHHYVSSPAGVLVITQSPEAKRARRCRARVVLRRRGAAGVRVAVLGRLLDNHAARRVRRARRLSASHRALVAVPHLPLIPGLQRGRDRALDILSVRRFAAAPGDAGRRSAAVFARFAKTVMQSSWMVVVFLLPVLLGVGIARCAPCMFYVTALVTVAPFCVIPVAAGTGTTLLLVNVFPARRARDILMLMGLVFAGSIVLLLRFIQPERLLRVESLPDVTGFFATLQSPITPMLPSFWAGETLFASLAGGSDLMHAGALWTTACAFTVILSAASERWYFAGFSKSQEARKARFTQLRAPRHDRGVAAYLGHRRNL